LTRSFSRSSIGFGSRSDIVWDEGLRFGVVVPLPLRESMYSVESCDAQKSRSASSVLNFGTAFFILTGKHYPLQFFDSIDAA
jgi:hypothetical protein